MCTFILIDDKTQDWNVLLALATLVIQQNGTLPYVNLNLLCFEI